MGGGRLTTGWRRPCGGRAADLGADRQGLNSCDKLRILDEQIAERRAIVM